MSKRKLQQGTCKAFEAKLGSVFNRANNCLVEASQSVVREVGWERASQKVRFGGEGPAGEKQGQLNGQLLSCHH